MGALPQLHHSAASSSFVNIILEVLAVDEFLDLILECNALFSSVTNVFMVLAIFILIPFGTVSTQRVRQLEYSSLFRSHEVVLP